MARYLVLSRIVEVSILIESLPDVSVSIQTLR